MDLIQAIRITQVLKDEGWIFIDNGINEILEVINKSTNERIKFDVQEQFIEWLEEQSYTKL